MSRSYIPTPWGHSQFQNHLADGIVFHETSSHGGIELSPERVKQLPKWAKKFESSYCSKPRWWEEDCEVGIPLIVFYDEIAHKLTKKTRDELIKCVRGFYPDRIPEFA